MNYFGRQLNQTEFRMTYHYEHEYIKDELYYAIAAAADKLYARYMQDLAIEKNLEQLDQIDAQVDRDGTTEATDMLNEIFKNKT